MIDLNKFFEEKKIPYTYWMIERENETYLIDTDVVIEAILLTQGEERRKIAETISRLDFKNANIVEYLHFLAKKLVANI